eukprot:Gb_29207 [translate_table: standard]
MRVHHWNLFAYSIHYICAMDMQIDAATSKEEPSNMVMCFGKPDHGAVELNHFVYKELRQILSWVRSRAIWYLPKIVLGFMWVLKVHAGLQIPCKCSMENRLFSGVRVCSSSADLDAYRHALQEGFQRKSSAEYCMSVVKPRVLPRIAGQLSVFQSLAFVQSVKCLLLVLSIIEICEVQTVEPENACSELLILFQELRNFKDGIDAWEDVMQSGSSRSENDKFLVP